MTDPLKSTVLTVDDEVDILKLLGYNLRKAGYNVIEAKDGPEALELAVSAVPDLILLDIMLPNMEGTEVLKLLMREDRTADIPVIMLTAKGEEVDRIVGFELGAEDYITKPFSPRELILRVKAVLKRKKKSWPDAAATGGDNKDDKNDDVLSYKELTVDSQRHRVTVKDKTVELTGTEFNLLKALLLSRGRALSRDTLLDRAWGRDCYVTERTVDTHVRRLREKLKTAGKYIETVRSVGYRFTEE